MSPFTVSLTLSATGLARTPGPHVVAEERHSPLNPALLTTQTLKNVTPPYAEHYDVTFSDFAEHPDAAGWLMCRAHLRVNGWDHGPKPLTFYAGTSTDWPTGLVSWCSPSQWDPHRQRDVSPGPVWQLSVRTVYGGNQ